MKQVRNAASHWGWPVLMAAVFIAAEAGSALAAEAQAQKSAAPAKAQEAAKKNPVDVNSADAKTLETLPRIGPVLANKIIAGRPYHNLTDLGKVKGLSQSKLDTIQDEVTFGPATTTAEETTRKQAAKMDKPARSTPTVDSKAPPASVSASANQTVPTTPQTAPSATGRVAGKLAPGEKININKASAEELDRLPGIGPVRAQAILDYRKQSGDFRTIEDIEKVKGIKAGEFSKIKDYVKVTD